MNGTKIWESPTCAIRVLYHESTGRLDVYVNAVVNGQERTPLARMLGLNALTFGTTFAALKANDHAIAGQVS